jgi:hypothetical protein
VENLDKLVEYSDLWNLRCLVKFILRTTLWRNGHDWLDTVCIEDFKNAEIDGLNQK